jgi:hypothetical protein
MEELGLRIMDLPFLAESICVVENYLTVTGNMVHSEVAHQATLQKVLALPCSPRRKRSPVGLDLDNAHALPKCNRMLLVVGRMQELKSENFRQLRA